MTFPEYPRCNEDIRTWRGPPEYMACTIVHKENDMRQLMAYKNLRQLFADDQRFLDTLVEALDILVRSKKIRVPAAWLYRFIQKEAMACSRSR